MVYFDIIIVDGMIFLGLKYDISKYNNCNSL